MRFKYGGCEYVGIPKDTFERTLRTLAQARNVLAGVHRALDPDCDPSYRDPIFRIDLMLELLDIYVEDEKPYPSVSDEAREKEVHP